jgi:hypothetical protein
MAAKLLLLAGFPLTSAQFVPSPENIPATGYDTNAGGIFCIALSLRTIRGIC